MRHAARRTRLLVPSVYVFLFRVVECVIATLAPNFSAQIGLNAAHRRLFAGAHFF